MAAEALGNGGYNSRVDVERPPVTAREKDNTATMEGVGERRRRCYVRDTIRRCCIIGVLYFISIACGKDVYAHQGHQRGHGNRQNYRSSYCLGSGLTQSTSLLEKQKRDRGAMQLPGARYGEEVTRFPPEPNGVLHIGHAKAAVLNEYFARHYNGTLIFRLDNTNPVLENKRFESEIAGDLRSIGISPDKVTHTSDYFETILNLIRDLVENGNAYVDDTLQEEMKYQRMHGIASKCRNNSNSRNMQMLEDMLKGTEIGRKYVVRAKINMTDLNKALRDPVLLRVLPVVKPKPAESYSNDTAGGESSIVRNQTVWKAFPTYDFACPVVDSLEGVTHALRTSEYKDRNPQYQWIQRCLGLRTVSLYEYSKVSFTHTILSKRKLNKLVQTNLVSGWDDPRMPTIRGLLRQGLYPEGLKDFMIRMGASKANNFMEWDKIWSINRQHIDPKSPRFWAIDANKCVRVELSGDLQSQLGKFRDIPLHRKFPKLSLPSLSGPATNTKRVMYSPVVYWDQADAANITIGEEITLMFWGNIIITDISRDSEGLVNRIQAKLFLEGDFRKTKKRIQWIPEKDVCGDDRVELVIKEYGPLLKEKKIGEDEEIEDAVNSPGVTIRRGYGEADLGRISENMPIQLERWGYFRVDKIEAASDTKGIQHNGSDPVANGSVSPKSNLSSSLQSLDVADDDGLKSIDTSGAQQLGHPSKTLTLIRIPDGKMKQPTH